MNNSMHVLLGPVLSTEEIKAVYDSLRQWQISIEREINALPDGQLYIRYRNNKPNYSNFVNGQSRGITKKPLVVHQLARRKFLLLQSTLIGQILEMEWSSITDDIINKICVQIEELLSDFETAGLDVDQIVLTPNQQIWNSNRHSQKQDRREDLIYPTKGRIYMRSKSEQAIGNLLESLHIPYRYEPRLRINSIDYYPDFIIMLPNDKLAILEHVGRMDLAEYNRGFISRLQVYNSVGLLIGRDVFLSFERDTRDEIVLMGVLNQIMTSRPSNNRYLIYVARNAGCNIDVT